MSISDEITTTTDPTQRWAILLTRRQRWLLAGLRGLAWRRA
jgi:hypothetical protein